MSILTRRQSILAAAALTSRTFYNSRGSSLSSCQAFVPTPFHRIRPNSSAIQLPASTSPGRHFLSSTTDETMSNIELPSKTGPRNGLHRHTIYADDSHPLRLYSRSPSAHAKPWLSPGSNARSILLLHGRTWSSQPVFDLRTSEGDEKKQSLLQSLSDLGFRAYALDLRGFGETPRDTDKHGNGGYTTPRRCVQDVKCAIDWITNRHYHELESNESSSDNSSDDPTVINTKPALLGWSQGALVAQLYAQQHASTISDLILFGSIYDPRVIYPRKPLYDPSGRLVGSTPENKPPAPQIPNTDVAALEDFTLPGTICDEAAMAFSSLALTVDPIKVAWDDLHEFNVANPALIHVPTMVICGSQDPYVSWEAQRELYERLGTEDKVWCVLPECDHAAHILKARKMFVRSVVGFLLRKEGF